MPSDHNPLRDAALHFAARSWYVFPLSPRSKKPIAGSRGLLDATTDENQVERWWSDHPQANIGIATGPSALVVLDSDGPEGVEELRRLVGIHGPLPRTLTSRTASGLHLVYRGNGVRSTARGSLHVRGEGGYIVAPPSVHPSGHVYTWVDRLAVVEALPDWVRAWRESLGGGPGDTLDLGAAPAFLVDGNLPARVSAASEPWSAHAEARVRAALKSIPADNYEIWCQIGMSLHALGWDRSDGTSIGRDIWDEWAKTCDEKYSDHAQQFHWNSFGRRSGINIGTLFHLAQKHGWDGKVKSDEKPPNIFEQPTLTLPAALTAPTVHWKDYDKAGNPRASCANTRAAIEALELTCRFDTFHNRMTVMGAPVQRWAGELSDKITHVVRVAIEREFGFDPGKDDVRDAIEQLCIEHPYDPIIDYLAGNAWDGRERVPTWTRDYLGSGDTALTRSMGALFLRAAVRRARQPGCKWDHVIVLEGPEDSGKSLALQTLAGPDNFSDQSILGRTDERQQEALEGVWIFEIAELTGMRRAEVEHVKAFVSRTCDRARPAYGHYREDRPRRCVFAGTTNEDGYLKSESGNRRFWPIRVGRINIDGLERDRDQLWAEAVAIEDRLNGALVLPAGLRGDARVEQDARLDQDPWVDAVAPWLVTVDGKSEKRTSVSDTEVMRDCLHLQPREQDGTAKRRVGHVLRRCGWEKYRQREPDGRLSYRYRLPVSR